MRPPYRLWALTGISARKRRERVYRARLASKNGASSMRCPSALGVLLLCRLFLFPRSRQASQYCSVAGRRPGPFARWRNAHAVHVLLLQATRKQHEKLFREHARVLSLQSHSDQREIPSQLPRPQRRRLYAHVRHGRRLH